MTNQTILKTLIHNFCDFLTLQKQRSSHTVSNYSRDIHQFFRIVALYDPVKISDETVLTYLKQLNQDELNQRSIHRKISSLDQFWRYLIHTSITDHNPWVSIRRPKINQKIPVYLEETAMLELLNNYPTSSDIDLRNKAILELLFSSGLRVNELVSLRLDAVSLDDHECRIVGKGDKERIGLFGSRARIALETYIKTVRSQWKIAKSVTLFISKSGAKLTPRTIQRIVKDANQYHSSTVDITPHSCRHTFASILISNGAGIRNIQELLGHSSITTTERYSHIPSKKLNQRFLDVISE